MAHHNNTLKNARKILINPKKQLKSAGAVLGISVFSFMLFCGIIFSATRYISKKIQTDISNLNDSIQIQKDINTAIEKFAKSVSSEIYEVSTTKVLKNSDKSFELINSHIDELSLFIKYNMFIFVALIIIQIVFCFFLYKYMVSFTHRVFGPERHISNMLKKIAANEPFTPRPLRKNDMLTDIYNEVLHLAEKKNLIK